MHVNSHRNLKTDPGTGNPFQNMRNDGAMVRTAPANEFDNQQTPQDQVAEELEVSDEYDYNEDVAYLQQFGRA